MEKIPFEIDRANQQENAMKKSAQKIRQNNVTLFNNERPDINIQDNDLSNSQREDQEIKKSWLDFDTDSKTEEANNLAIREMKYIEWGGKITTNNNRQTTKGRRQKHKWYLYDTIREETYWNNKIKRRGSRNVKEGAGKIIEKRTKNKEENKN